MAANSQFLHNQKHDTAFVHVPPDHAVKRILLVDNQAHVLRVMKSALGRYGYAVDTAMSGDLALGKLRDAHFDVVIVDSGLEKRDGQQLIHTIDDQFGDQAPAMFLVTDQNTDTLQQWCTQFDRTECLQSPISINYLDECLDELFGD